MIQPYFTGSCALRRLCGSAVQCTRCRWTCTHLQQLAPPRPRRTVEQVHAVGLHIQREACLDQPSRLLDPQRRARRLEPRQLARARLRFGAREEHASATRALVGVEGKPSARHLLHTQLLEPGVRQALLAHHQHGGTHLEAHALLRPADVAQHVKRASIRIEARRPAQGNATQQGLRLVVPDRPVRAGILQGFPIVHCRLALRQPAVPA
mmetsp:Transcript_52727/g.126487  ORF Transcript_52727/g.126487 Transcript_52727/m.126487 type:complete len:209 (-) Transcript_52727:301-927(-)